MPFGWDILFYFFLGAASTMVLGWLALHRRLKLSEEKRRNLLLYARKEADYAAQEIKAQAQREIDQQRASIDAELSRRDVELEHRAKALDAAFEACAHEEKRLAEKTDQVEQRRQDTEKRSSLLDDTIKLYRDRMHKLSSLSPEALREAVMEETRRDCEAEVRALKHDLLKHGEQEVEAEARRILIATMQRISSTPQYDVSATLVPIDNEEMKGRLIGREGRNIKTFEKITGTTLLVDDTPDSVLISCFDPVRREVARIALEALIKDGRIHPTSIEEQVAAAEENVEQLVIEFGEDALRRVRLNHVHPDIVRALGRLHYRLSNNQNTLEHSIEVAQISALLAAELNLPTEPAKRAGLMHDMGKVIDQDHEGSHAVVAANILKRCNEDDRVINAVAAHHNEIEDTSPYAALLRVADSISTVRPGARSESLDAYIKRVKSLERLARSFNGVVDAYAIQAGREVRIIVEPEKLDDLETRELARNIRKRIEDDLVFPGSIKVTVIRESRFVETAR